jgi:hypothetical protein
LAFCAVVALYGSGDREAGADAVRSPGTGYEVQQHRVDINPVPLERLIGTAQLIVVGFIGNVNEDRFAFHAEEDLSHRDFSGLVVVARAALPEFFAPRTTPYARGQRFILFLDKPDGAAADQPWNVLGAPIAGALPIDDDHAYFDSYDLPGFEFSDKMVHGTVKPVQQFDLAEFKDAVRGYRICFDWRLETRIKNQQVRTRWIPSRTCDEDQLREFRGKSRIQEYLARTTLGQIPGYGD